MSENGYYSTSSVGRTAVTVVYTYTTTNGSSGTVTRVQDVFPVGPLLSDSLHKKRPEIVDNKIPIDSLSW